LLLGNAFRKHCRITVENIGEPDPADASKRKAGLFYQVDGEFGNIPEDAAYFCAQFRRANPLPYKDVYTIVDGIKGRGHYVGTYMAWQVNSNGWWGEGEIKFYMDGDLPDARVGRNVKEHGGEHYPPSAAPAPRITSAAPITSRTRRQSSTRNFPPPTPAYLMLSSGWHLQSQYRFSLYRWHLADPIRFQQIWLSPSRALAGVTTGHSCHCRTTLPPSPSGTSNSRTLHSRRCPAAKRWKFIESRLI